MSDIAIKVDHLSKQYTIGERARYRTLRETIVGAFRPGQSAGKSNKFQALSDVSFQVNRGEVLGIIGRNGAGKSTLLKILSRITEPTAGRIEIEGRVGSLLEVGTGFHAELTGRENIYLNGAILGMTRSQITAKFDEIVAFAETEKFLDTPVKHYSSGMYTRLAFAVAAHLEPEILIIDEVLAVGDTGFQKKCMGKMGSVARDGRTVLFVSHNLTAVRSLCARAVLLDQGRAVLEADTEVVLNEYLRAGHLPAQNWRRTNPPSEHAPIFFEQVEVRSGRGSPGTALDSAAPFSIVLTVTARQPLTGIQLAIRLTNQEGVVVFTTANSDASHSLVDLPEGRQTYAVQVPGSFLPPGQYTTVIAVHRPGVTLFDIVENEVGFTIEDMGTHATVLRDGRQGVVTPLLQWTLRREQ